MESKGAVGPVTAYPPPAHSDVFLGAPVQFQVYGRGGVSLGDGDSSASGRAWGPALSSTVTCRGFHALCAPAPVPFANTLTQAQSCLLCMRGAVLLSLVPARHVAGLVLPSLPSCCYGGGGGSCRLCRRASPFLRMDALKARSRHFLSCLQVTQDGGAGSDLVSRGGLQMCNRGAQRNDRRGRNAGCYGLQPCLLIPWLDHVRMHMAASAPQHVLLTLLPTNPTPAVAADREAPRQAVTAG